MTDFHDWDDIRAELFDGDGEALEVERARTETWVSAFHLAEERKRLGLTQRQVADLMGVTPGRVSQIENGDLDANEVATLSRYARALGARMRIIFDYGNDLRQIAEPGAAAPTRRIGLSNLALSSAQRRLSRRHDADARCHVHRPSRRPRILMGEGELSAAFRALARDAAVPKGESESVRRGSIDGRPA